MRIRILLLFVCPVIGVFSNAYEPGDDVPADFKMPKPLPLETALKTLKTKPGLEIELVAAEPLVMDPIAIDFGPAGKLWVVEMADYPLGMDGKNKPGGRVRFLTDSDSDGKFDRSTLFLDGLNFPTGVKAWKNGVLVIAAPEIFYAEDTTGDGVADTREVLFRGFREGNQQHRVNGLVWGLDNFLHLANGDSGGTIESVKTGEKFELGSFDLKIRPDTGEMVKTSGRTQYGRVRDDFGNWFGCSNSKPLFQFALRQETLARNPHVVYPPAAVSITDPAWAPKVYPTSESALRYNTPGATSRITSACGLTLYRDDALGDEFYGNAFICEPVHNLVHRRVLTRPDGELIFKAERAEDEEDSEFFTSTDPWCRPVSATTGPDGALWLVDMHRFVIEHPEWIPEPWQKVLDLRAGHELGRIYRIKNKNCSKAVHEPISAKSDAELVALLGSRNGRLRDMAHQILYERRVWEKSKQQGLFSETTGSVRTDETNEQGSIVKTEKLSALHQGNLKFGPKVLYRVDQRRSIAPDASVYEVAGSLSVLSGNLGRFVNELNPEVSPHYIRGIFETMIGGGELIWLNTLLAPNEIKSPSQQERYAILLSVLDRRKMSLDDLRKKLGSHSQDNLGKCLSYSIEAREILNDENASLVDRIGAVGLVGRDKTIWKADAENLLKLVTSSEAKLAKAAIKRLGEMREFGFLVKLHSVTSEIRRAMLETAIGHRDGVGKLLDLAEGDDFPLALIDAASRSRLTSYGSGDLRKRAQKLFDEATNSNRAEVIGKFEAALKIEGADAKAGRVHFQTLCIACHDLDGVGVAGLGPDLRGLSDKSANAFLIAILDPNRAVEDKYLLTTVTAKDGSSSNVGMIEGETGDGIVLKKLDGTTETIPRSGISKLETTGKSAMPEGLEAALDVQKMAELIAFLRSATK